MRALLVAIAVLAFILPAGAKTWEPHEKWTYTKDRHWVHITGRKLVPWKYKINPVWWYRNDFEPNPPSWYEPGKKQLKRKIDWYLRNPWQNAGRYVFGVADRDVWVHDPFNDVDLTDYAGVGKTGCIHKDIYVGKRGQYVVLPFYSCTFRHFMFYAGWQESGFFGFKFNLLKSKFQLF